MSEAIVRMTAAGFGLLAVVDRNGMLVGVISDGDLRRHMSPKLLEEPVEAVMTGNPVVIGADDIAAKALELLQSRKVGALLVVDGGKPVGITRFHDLLNVGFL
jgi:arabinose-5-phosphate isomerase